MSAFDDFSQAVGDAIDRADWSIVGDDAEIKSLDDLERMLSPGRAMGDWALRAALSQMGIEIGEGEPVNEESITRAVNETVLAGSGVEIANLFDRGSVLRALEVVALEKLGESLGFPEIRGLSGLRDAIRAELAAEVAAQVAEESGDLIEGAPDVRSIARAIAAVGEASGWNEPSDLSAAGESNRERQRRYRATHTKHWEERP